MQNCYRFIADIHWWADILTANSIQFTYKLQTLTPPSPYIQGFRKNSSLRESIYVLSVKAGLVQI